MVASFVLLLFGFAVLSVCGLFNCVFLSLFLWARPFVVGFVRVFLFLSFVGDFFLGFCWSLGFVSCCSLCCFFWLFCVLFVLFYSLFLGSCFYAAPFFFLGGLCFLSFVLCVGVASWCWFWLQIMKLNGFCLGYLCCLMWNSLGVERGRVM